MLGDGTGGLTEIGTYSTGSYPHAITGGDFNDDGVPDLATISWLGYRLTVFIGQGDGTFSSQRYPMGTNLNGVAAGDFNGDGKTDLAVAVYWSEQIAQFWGNGDGTFTEGDRVSVSSGGTPRGIRAGDFNDDGVDDILVNMSHLDQISIFLGTAGGNLTWKQDLGYASSYNAVADFNSDGALDLVVTSGGDLYVLIGNGDGTFSEKLRLDHTGTDVMIGVATGDFNGDGLPDVAVGIGPDGDDAVSILINTSPVTMKFDPPADTVSHPSSFTEDIAIDGVENMGAFKFGLHFDPSKLQVDQINLGDFLARTGNTASPVGPTIDNENGEATFGGFSFGANPGPSGSGVLATITFTTKDVAEAGTSLRLQDVKVTDKEGNPISVNVEDGTVTITSCYLYDIDCDGDVDVVDIQLVAAKWGAKSEDPNYVPRCDIDSDQDIDVVDIQRVAAYWGERAPFAKMFARVFAGGLTVSIAPGELVARGPVQVSVAIDQAENLGAFEFELGYSPEIVHVEDVRLGDLLGSTGNSASLVGPTIDNTTGRIVFGGFSFGANAGPSGSGTLAVITFIPVASGTSTIDFLSIQITDKEGQVLALSGSNPGVITDVEEEKDIEALPNEFSLSQNFPNPFNPTTEIRYQLPEASYVMLAVYDALGQEVRVLVDGFVDAGYRAVVWDAQEAASGIYLVRMEAGDFVGVRKMALIR